MRRSELIWRMSHNPYSRKEIRCENFKRAQTILGEIEFCETPQIFPLDQADMDRIIELLPDGTSNDCKDLGKSQRDVSELEFNTHHYLKVTKQHFRKVQSEKLVGIQYIVEPYRKWFMNYLNHSHDGLTLNLLLAIEYFVNSNRPFFLFMEDDFSVPDNILNEMAFLIRELPSDFDCFSFVASESEFSNYQQWMQLRPGSRISRSYQSWPMACMLFSRKGAIKLLYSFFKESTTEDTPLNLLRLNDNRVFNFKYVRVSNKGLETFIDNSDNREFQTYTFTPDRMWSSRWLQEELESTWNNNK